MGTAQFQRRFQTGRGGSDHRAGLPGCGSIERAGCQPAFALRLEEEVLEGFRRRVIKAVEIRRLKSELARVTEERDILKKATAYFARDAK